MPLQESNNLFYITCVTYENLIRQYSLVRSFVLGLNENEKKCLEGFIEHYKTKYPNIGQDFIIMYTTYQFEYWNRLNTRHAKGYVPVYWVYGKKAIARFDEDKKFRWDKKNTKVETKNVVVKELHAEKNKEFLTSAMQHEDEEKSKFLNTNKGIGWCSYNTTLYNHKSSVCAMCNFTEECKSILKANMPNLYKIRGY